MGFSILFFSKFAQKVTGDRILFVLGKFVDFFDHLSEQFIHFLYLHQLNQ